MSIFFNIGRNPTPDFVEIDYQFIPVKNLKSLISRKIGVGEQDMKVRNVITSIQYAPNQYIKKGSSVSIDITARNLVDQPLKFHEIISNERLEAMMTDCRFYIAKSSNQDNIQKARDCSVWATTFPNQDKFKTAFQCFKHVFILFGTNRSFELKGLARMESEPDKVPDKSIWNGVSNIRLGGNFKLRWIRKKPLSMTTIEKKLGAEARDQISKATDGYEPDLEVAKKVALLFELPSEPYYKVDEIAEGKKDSKVNKIAMNNLIGRSADLFTSQFTSVMLKNFQQSSKIDQLGISEEISNPVFLRPLPNSQKKQSISQKKEEKLQKKEKKQKKLKKRKEKKSSKKRKRNFSSSSSSRSRSRSPSSSSSSSSSDADNRRKRTQKHPGTQKATH